MTTRERIESAAAGLREKWQTANPFELCDYLEIPVLWQDLPTNTGGFCVSLRGRTVVVLNQQAPAEQREYLCAHELGHVLLHNRVNSVRMELLTNLSVPKLENEADYFAACLLMKGSLDQWRSEYSPLTTGQAAALSGLPERVVRLGMEDGANFF